MPSHEFVEAVLNIVPRVPPGTVVTYGDIALMLQSNAPRAVGRVLALYGHSVPWWRVVPASGLPPQGHAREAFVQYQAEHTPLRAVVSPTEYRIRLHEARLTYDHELYREVAL